ncbi:MAG: tetratricopeptide repeat protein [candidate division KSB1 bacterium]|jgi:tetratricopeptide (TPR) repeat protein|nr:tetratricopeptide repeat protein [candidate division KSB1 bacterium]
MKKYIPLIIVFILFACSVHAQEQFTTYIPNARAEGYGGSQVAFFDSPSLVFWNPGALSFATDDQIMINATDPFSLNYISYSQFIAPKQSLGFSLNRNTQNNYSLDIATIAYSYRINQFFSAGANLNYGQYNNDHDDFTSFGVGLLLKSSVNRSSFTQSDFSMLDLFTRPDFYDRFAFGLMIHNIPLGNSSSPHQLRIGAGYQIFKKGPHLNFGYHIHRNDNTSHFGAGFDLMQNIALYSGVTDFDMNSFAFGGRFSFGMLSTEVTYSSRTEKLSISLVIRTRDSHLKIAKRYADDGAKSIKEANFRDAYKAYRNSLAYNQNNKAIIYFTDVLSKKIEIEDIKIDSLIDRAEYFENKGWFLNATINYKKVIAIDSSNNKARHKINKLRPKCDSEINIRYKNGKKWYAEKNLEKAKTVFREILLIDEEHRGALTFLAKIDSINSIVSNELYYRSLGYFNQKRLDRSHTLLKQVLALNPNHENAKTLFEKVKKEIATSKPIIYRLFDEGLSLHKRGRYVSAINKYEEILKMNSDFEPARKQLELSRAIIRNIVDPKYSRARRLFDKGQYTAAQNLFNDIVRMKPDHQQAQFYLRKIREVEANSLNDLYNTALTHYRNDRWNSALNVCEQILSQNPNHADAKQLKNEIYNNMRLKDLQESGLALFKQGEYLRAKRLFQQILSKDPGDVIARSYLQECDIKLNKRSADLFRSGMAYFTSGKYEMAIMEWNRVLEIDPDNESALEYKKRAQEMLNALKELD